MNGWEELAEARKWASIYALRMKSPIVVIGLTNHETEAHGGWTRSFIARRPIIWSLAVALVSAVFAVGCFHG